MTRENNLCPAKFFHVTCTQYFCRSVCVFKVMMAKGKTENTGKKDYEMVGRDSEKLAR